MNIKLKQLILFLCISLSATLSHSESSKDEELNCYLGGTKCLGDIVFFESGIHSTENPPRYSKIITIRKIVEKKISPESSSTRKVLGEVIWTITPNMLPANANTCLSAGIKICEANPKQKRYENVCYNSCVKTGPEFLAYDQKRKLLYLLADTENVGPDGGPYLGFLADLNTKTIKYLKVFPGFSKGELSPSGKYLLIENLFERYIDIYNTETGEDFKLPTDNVYIDQHKKIHLLDRIYWRGDTRFAYRDSVSAGGPVEGIVAATENVYDIPTHKIIESYTSSRSEYENDVNHSD